MLSEFDTLFLLDPINTAMALVKMGFQSLFGDFSWIFEKSTQPFVPDCMFITVYGKLLYFTTFEIMGPFHF